MQQLTQGVINTNEEKHHSTAILLLSDAMKIQYQVGARIQSCRSMESWND